MCFEIWAALHSVTIVEKDMHKCFNKRIIIACCGIFLLIAGCGGGDGGDDTSDNASNSAPVANAGDDQTVSIADSENQTITLNGTASDSDGTIASQQWKQTSGESVALTGANTNTATFTVNAKEQIYTFSYTVVDDKGASSSDDTHVTVITNKAPTSDAGEDQTATENDTVTLDGSGSTDTDGEISSYLWTQIDSTGVTVTLSDATAATPSFIVPDIETAGITLSFRLTVADDDGAQSTDDVSVDVNLRPIAAAGTDQTATEGETVTLNGSGSRDEDGDISTYAWAQTDSTGITVTLSDTTAAAPTFAAPDINSSITLIFQLTVTDDNGAEQSDTVEVYVTNVIFSDTFSDSSSAYDWDLTHDDTGNGASWTVANNTIQQNANASSKAFFSGSSYHSGTYALLTDASMSGVSDYRCSVDLLPLSNNDGLNREGNDVGIMFRYLNANNYYRISVNARCGFTRFEKCVGGTFETLAVNARGYVENQLFNITVELSGDTIVVWIDDDPVFAAVDGDIASGTMALYCQDRAWFDNVLITGNSPQPTVAIVSPLAYSVALTADDGDTLTAQAVVLNAPSGGSVGFALDDDSEVPATLSDGLYSLDFSGVEDGEHELTAVLRDNDGNEVSSDINTTIGVGGDYILTIGDSITNGVGDDDDSDNETLDGRIIAIQGYQAPLADARTDTTGLPQIIFNEGVAGDKTSDLNDRIISILDRHPRANKVLMMIGTNDSNAGVTRPTYWTTINAIANMVDDTYGMRLWIAKPMPTYLSSDPTTLDSDRNAVIEQYNAAIDTLVGTSSVDDRLMGPNFYTLFTSSAYYSDYLHPNDTGYQLMADRWYDVLVADD